MSVSYRQSSESDIVTIVVLYLGAFEWYYGLHLDAVADEVYTRLRGKRRKGTVRDRCRSVEEMYCIRWVIGYFDRNGRRYFIDPQSQQFEENGDARLMGLATI